MNPTRRQFLATSATAGVGAVAGCASDGDDAWRADVDLGASSAVLYSSPTCGCCGGYAAYLEDTGVRVDVREIDAQDHLVAHKRALGVPAEMDSCHTVAMDDYVIEGHVPLEAIEALFDEGAPVTGIAVPGMPRNAPGMGPPSDEPLVVFAFDDAGETTEFVEL